MRTFVAVEIGEGARGTLARMLEEMRSLVSSGVRWTRPELVHVTLRFLGEVADGLIPEVAAAARAAASGIPPFSLALGSPASFGGRSPRVLLLGVAGETDRIVSLAAALENELDARGFGREARRFSPHLTLGRRKGGPVPDAWRRVRPAGAADWDVEELVVFSSTLTPGGPIYTALARCPLEGEGTAGPGPKTET